MSDKPDVYFAYLDDFDGGWDLGYFWNELDAFISCLNYHKKELESLNRAVSQCRKKGNSYYDSNNMQEYKNSKIRYIKKIKKLRIKKICIK